MRDTASAVRRFSSSVIWKENLPTGLAASTVTFFSPASARHSPDVPSFKNCANTTLPPCPAHRTASPTAAVVFPFPSPQYK